MQNMEIPENSRHKKIQQLVARASQLSTTECDVFLGIECGDDHALRQEIYDHLFAESKGGSRIQTADQPGPVTSAVKQALDGSSHDRRIELLGKVVGDYRLSAIIGAGGVGTVYLGERADRQYSAQVAVKVVANAQLTHEVQRRFAAERQILANLNHPNIGRLLDAGETVFDEPFLIMEYVHGEHIDRYCDNQRLPVVDRIRLFLKVCDAVQYAHRNLIVHRDLKPGNILVSTEGIPKLLDFGIAKLLDESAQALSQETIVAHTRVNDRLVTPEYASPEQIRGLPVTTASDVYSLGVVLYELLTGTRPYAVNSMSQLELERSVCIQDPLKPSQRIGALANQAHVADPSTNDLQRIALARSSTFKKLQHQLQGDLDAIVLRALRKEPEHRYGSVEHLLDDLNRHITQQPVEARQGNRWYYTQRFVRRHTLGVAAGTTALASLIAVAIILSLQAHRLTEQRDIAKQQRDKATQESQRAEAVSNFMLDVFTAADPFQSQDKQVTAKELLDNAAKKIETTLNDQPESKARLLASIGTTYLNQGSPNAAIKYLEEALSLQRQVASDKFALAVTLDALGHAYGEINNVARTNSALTEASVLMQQSNHTASPEYIQLLSDLAGLEYISNNIESAQDHIQHGLEIAQKIYGKNDKNYAGMLMMLSQIMTIKGRLIDAEKLSRDAIDVFHATLPEKHPERLNAELNLAVSLWRQGKFSEARPMVIRVLADQISVVGDNNPMLIRTYIALSKIQLLQHDPEAAEVTIRKALAISEKRPNSSTAVAVVRRELADVLFEKKNFRDAERENLAALATFRATLHPDDRTITYAEYTLSRIMVATHRLKDAVALLKENVVHSKRANAPAGITALSEGLLGAVLLQLHQSAEASALLKHADEVLSGNDTGVLPQDVEIAHKRLEQFKRCEVEERLDNCEVEI